MALIICLLQQSSKWLSCSRDYKRTRQGAFATLILYLYYRLLVCATTIFTYYNVHALSSCPITHLHMFSLRPPCFLHVPWHHTFNLCCTCAHHVYTIRNHCSLTSLLTLTPSRLFPILLDPKFFQTVLDFITWLPDHVLSIRCRLIIILTISVWLTLILAKVCSHLVCKKFQILLLIFPRLV